MTSEEKIRQIMLAEKLSCAEKLDRLYALIPPDACKIDNLSQATPAQPNQAHRPPVTSRGFSFPGTLARALL